MGALPVTPPPRRPIPPVGCASQQPSVVEAAKPETNIPGVTIQTWDIDGLPARSVARDRVEAAWLTVSGQLPLIEFRPVRCSFLFLGGRLQFLQPLFKLGEALDQFALALVFLRLRLYFLPALFCILQSGNLDSQEIQMAALLAAAPFSAKRS